jgi:hypothetical protein
MEAWARWSWCYDDLTHPRDFSAGFRAGYHDILNGGAGCQPTLPPRSYWKACYRNAEGHCKVNAWFEGFSHGALAAQKDGASTYGHIPLSPTAHGNLAKANEAPPIYDWSAATDSVPAPGPSPFSGYQSPQSMDSTIAPAAPPASPSSGDDVPALKTYEDDAKPLLDEALETTSGKVNLPNLGG